MFSCGGRGKRKKNVDSYRWTSEKERKKKKPTKMNWSWCLVIRAVCLACASCTFVCVYIISMAVWMSFFISFFFNFHFAVFSMRRLLSASLRLFWNFIDTERAWPKLLLNLRARAREHFYIPPQFKTKMRTENDEGESGRIIVGLRRAPACLVWVKRSTKEKQRHSRFKFIVEEFFFFVF